MHCIRWDSKDRVDRVTGGVWYVSCHYSRLVFFSWESSLTEVSWDVSCTQLPIVVMFTSRDNTFAQTDSYRHTGN